MKGGKEMEVLKMRVVVVSEIFQILKQGHAQRSSHSRSQLGAFVRSQKETKQWSTQGPGPYKVIKFAFR